VTGLRPPWLAPMPGRARTVTRGGVTPTAAMSSQMRREAATRMPTTLQTAATSEASGDVRPRPEPQVRDRAPDTAEMPLTAALLTASRTGTSFATPGHRGGRSCQSRL
jgi:hypothetical protein